MGVLAAQAPGNPAHGLLRGRTGFVITHKRTAFASASNKVLPQLELLGSVEPVECRLTCSLLAAHKYCAKPWTDLCAVAYRTDLLN